MIVYRLARKQYAHDLSGKGAEMAGGRWNSIGVALVYTCESRALCTTEIAVHIPLGIAPKGYCMISIYIPDLAFYEVTDDNLPAGWNQHPPSHMTQKIGDQFVSLNEFLVMKVPSVVVRGDYNYLINPGHKLFKSVRIESVEPFELDERLFLK